MNGLKYPIEILNYIGEYLDIFDILKLQNVNKYCYYVFKYKINAKLKEYVLSNNLEIGKIDNVNRFFYIHVLFCIKRCIEDKNSGILNITIMKVFSKDKEYKHKLFAECNNKCIYFLKGIDNFCNNIDLLENFLLDCKINNRRIVKGDDVSNMTDIFLHRINYNEIRENEIQHNEIQHNEIQHNEETRFKDELIMVTFYFFL
jgi:hypothetical protein